MRKQNKLDDIISHICGFCNQLFKREVHLDRHIDEFHSNNKEEKDNSGALKNDVKLKEVKVRIRKRSWEAAETNITKPASKSMDLFESNLSDLTLPESGLLKQFSPEPTTLEPTLPESG